MSTADFSLPIKEFLSSKHALVVDPSSAFISNISMSLHNLGIDSTRIHGTGKFKDALVLIDRHRPHIIITEYFLGKSFGLDLIDAIDKIHGENNRVAIVITSNASDSAIAEAAEGQIDAYILKPFSMFDFQGKISEALNLKVTPTPYTIHLRKGKECLDLGEIEQAMIEFESAKKVGKKPSLAHFYMGLGWFTKNNHAVAINEFKSGLDITPLHYKCLTGKFDSLFQIKNYPEAYKHIQDMIENYPISPLRLMNFIITSVYTNHFEDLNRYHEMYRNLDHRPTELVRIGSLSMRTAGRYYMKENNLKKAFELFEIGVSMSGLDVDFLEETIKELLKSENLPASQAAAELYKKYPRQLIGSERHAITGFLIDCYIQRPDESFERGKKLMAQYKPGPDFFRRMVKLAKEINKKTYGEEVISRALISFPDMRKELYDLLEN